MTDRRRFLQTLAGVPPLLAINPVLAAPDPTRVALVIGNAAYRQAPLENPVNDASAMRDLLSTAGFTTDSRLNASRTDLLAAVERFAEAALRSDTRQAIFYYAGHGVQLDWRNYLLPVDAVVQSPTDVRSQCVDLGILLGKLSRLKDKTFVIILDACRDDPFRGAYRPEQKGLSQFDAPVGSLLAYATSPGNVASDGAGKNGLYTENLVRELSNRGAKIEDALKRVRLNVRLRSEGSQIPWETTSLESDVFLFPDGQKKLTEAELERLIEEEMAIWSRLKNSKQANDWIAYLQQYPNGRFAEIAQGRLNRLLAEQRKPPATQATAAATPVTTAVAAAIPTPTASTAGPPTTPSTPVSGPGVKPSSTPSLAPSPAAPSAPALILKPGGDMNLLVQASANPNSAGRFELGRRFTVGDMAEVVQSDILTGVIGKTFSARITRVDEESDRVEMNDGQIVTDLMGNLLRASSGYEFDSPQQLFPGELQIGKKWKAAFKTRAPNGATSNTELDVKVAAFEQITVPAGTFSAFRIEASGWALSFGTQLETKLWVVPGFNFTIRREHMARNRGRYLTTDRTELVSATQQRFGQDCAMMQTGQKTRSLVVRQTCSA